MTTAITVKTLNEDALRLAAGQLAAKVLADFMPDIVVGIRTGGYTLATQMLRHMLPQTPFVPLTCRRRSTKAKSRFPLVKIILMKLPYCITDPLRVMEHRRLMRTRKAQPLYFSPDASETCRLRETLERIGENAKILVIDDAVDSGATLAAALSVVHTAAGNTPGIKTAAITTTMPSPLVQPDYVLYHNVLCRFPWSLDSRR